MSAGVRAELARKVPGDSVDHAVHLARAGHLALAECLDCLDAAASAVLKDSLDLPDATVLRAIAEHPDYLARVVRMAAKGLVDPQVLRVRPALRGGLLE